MNTMMMQSHEFLFRDLGSIALEQAKCEAFWYAVPSKAIVKKGIECKMH